MWQVRPARQDDIAEILALARHREGHLSSTLPAREDVITGRLEVSDRSFRECQSPACHRFLFVLEELTSGRVRGVAGIDARAGNGQPFYSYRRDALIHASHELHISSRVEVLYPSHALTDLSLFCTFVIDPDLRGGDAFELLSRARILFIAEHRHCFSHELVAEIPGLQADDGTVPFWDGLGRHFFNMDFATADQYSATHSKTFIAELMPHNPIYVTLLAEPARAAMGQPHRLSPDTVDLLRREGFRSSDYLDIFDGGPVLTAHTDSLRTLATSHLARLHGDENEGGETCMIACGTGEDFRCALASVSQSLNGDLKVHPEVWLHLRCSPGDLVRVVAL